MKRGATIFLRGVIIAIGLVVLAVCIFGLPRAIIAELDSDFDYLPLMLGLYVTAIPFLYALHQALALLRYIDKRKAFSTSSVKALRSIKYCAFAIGGAFAAGLPYLFWLAEQDDAPGIVAVGMVIIGASLVIATFAGVAQKLFQNALDIKSENDLTV